MPCSALWRNNMNNIYLKNEENAIFALRSLYQKYGYRPYKMSKFEEYDLYLKNKNFLVSDNIITFTDTDGKLMALKPDVTLSIIKNMKDKTGCVQKVYYNENVYRVSKGTKAFKEIMQTGLECIGNIDDYTIYEVIMLALESLHTISKDYVMDISYLGIVSKVIDAYSCSDNIKKQIIKCVGEKNLSEIISIEKSENIDLSKVKELISTYGTLSEVLPFLKSLDCVKEAEQIEKIMRALEQNGYKNKVRLDFSIISDMKYYNGFVFKGFINGIPESVLSGGQYDNLMSKMGRSEMAIGFAVYLDMLERLSCNKSIYDIDAVILYDDYADINEINDAVKLMSQGGNTVTAQKSVPTGIRYKKLARLTKRGVKILENNT